MAKGDPSICQVGIAASYSQSKYTFSRIAEIMKNKERISK